MKYLNRTKLQAAILAVLLVMANRWFDLGMDNTQLTLVVLALLGYIVGEAYVDGAKKQ